MTHRIEQPTLFELTGCDEFVSPGGLPPDDVTPNADLSTPEPNVSSRERVLFRAVSPWASMPLHEVCATCGRQITGSGFVILDYEELGAFCNQECADKGFRSYLYEAPEEGRLKGTAQS